MNYQIRKVHMEDLPAVQGIYTGARIFMAEHDNPTQWENGYPSKELLEQDIRQENLYLIYDQYGIHGVFYFSIEDDPTYAVIYEGNWSCNQRYGVIHRIAGDGSGGILRTAVEFASNQIGYLRIDTHDDNYVMQKALEKMRFSKCGIIYIEDGTPRIAYDFLHAN